MNNPQPWRVPPTLTRANYRSTGGGLTKHITLPTPAPSFPPKSRALYDTFRWDQKNGPGNNLTQLSPGNYTLTVSLDGPVDYGKGANWTIAIFTPPLPSP